MTEYSYKTCPECGVHYAVDKYVMDYREKDAKKSWFCPNGHSLIAREWESTILQREINRLKQDAARLEDEKRIAIRQADLARAEAKRVSRRATAAVCPCCNRSFSQLARHMKAKHPEVAPFKPMPVGRKVRA